MAKEVEKTSPIFKQIFILGIVTAAGFVASLVIEILYNAASGTMITYTNYVLPFACSGAIIVLSVVGMKNTGQNGSVARVFGIIILIAAILVALVGGNVCFSYTWNSIMTIRRSDLYPEYLKYLWLMIPEIVVSVIVVILSIVIMKGSVRIIKLTEGYKKTTAK
jgi:hypothetical protein